MILSPLQKNNKSPSAIFIGLLLVIPIYLYFPALNGPFLFDDYPNIINNSAVQLTELSLQYLQAAARSYGGINDYWRSLSMLSFAGNYYLHGLNPALFKLTNLIIHLLNVVCVYVLVRLLLTVLVEKRGVVNLRSNVGLFSFFVSLLWAIHPLNLTSVLYVVQRMNSLSAHFVLLGMLVYSCGRVLLDKRTALAILLMAFALIFGTFLSFFSKENGILLPVFILLIEWTLFGFSSTTVVGKRSLKILWIGFLILSLGAVLFYLNSHPGFLLNGYETYVFSLKERVFTEARVLFFYLKMILLPAIQDFALFHDDFTISTSLFSPVTTFLSIVGLLGLLVAALLMRIKYPLYSFAVLFFLVGHSLESSFIPLEIIHEHRNYIPDIGIILLIVLLVESIPAIKGRLFVNYGCLALFGLFFFLLTHERVSGWRSSRQLTMTDVVFHPESSRSQYQLGLLYAQDMATEVGDTETMRERAIEKFYLAAELDPFQKNGALLAIARVAALKDGKISVPLLATLLDNLARQRSSALLTTNFVSLLESIDQNRGYLPFPTIAEMITALLHNSNIRAENKAQVLAAAINVALQEKEKLLAFRYAKKAVQLNPHHLQHRINYATLLISFGELEDAREEIIAIKTSNFYYTYKSKVETLEKMIATYKSTNNPQHPPN